MGGAGMLGKLSRRKALAIFGATPVSTAFAAKQALDAAIGQAAGLGGIVAPGGFGVSGQHGGSLPGAADDGWRKPYLAAAEYARTFGLPPFVEESYRRDAQYVQALDPDIACKRSWSMSVKIATQRQRNYERRVATVQQTAAHHKAAMLLKTFTKWEWPW